MVTLLFSQWTQSACWGWFGVRDKTVGCSANSRLRKDSTKTTVWNMVRKLVGYKFIFQMEIDMYYIITDTRQPTRASCLFCIPLHLFLSIPSSRKKNMGNYLVARKEFEIAASLYRLALEAGDEPRWGSDDDVTLLQSLINEKMAIHCNMALCQIKVRTWTVYFKHRNFC